MAVDPIVLWAWTMLAVLAALIEHDKQGTFATGFILGLLLGPLGVLISLLSGGKQAPPPADWQKPVGRPLQCPECKAPTSPAYRFCDRCGASLKA